MATERVGNSGDSVGGLGRYLKKLAWLGLVSAGVGGWGGGGGLPPPQISSCDVKFSGHFVCVCGAMALCVHGSVCGYKLS